MTMFVLFGVNAPEAQTVDDAAILVTKLINVAPVKRVGDSSGHYCTFESASRERIKLVQGTYTDESGDYPAEQEFPEWKYLAYLDYTIESSAWLQALDGASEMFSKLRSKIVE